MTIICPELIALNELQNQFEDVAREQETSPFIKLREMSGVLDGMSEILERAKLIGAPLVGDTADHILDFIARDDLSMKWIDTAFEDNDLQADTFKRRLLARMDVLQKSAEEFDRTVSESFTLPPDQPE